MRWLATVLTVLFIATLAACGGQEEPEEEEVEEALGASPEATEPAAEVTSVDFGGVIFLHHSVGASLIEQGDVRSGLTDLGYDFTITATTMMGWSCLTALGPIATLMSLMTTPIQTGSLISLPSRCATRRTTPSAT